jgi:hypothetical protein
MNGATRRLRLALQACFTQVSRIASWADITTCFIRWAKALTLGYSSEFASFHMNVQGMHPEFKKKGAYPVISDLDTLIANSMAGNVNTQSHCIELIHECSICPIVRFVRLVAPSDCGWYALDIL